MATIKLDETWIKDALVTIEDVTDKEVTDLLKDLADKRIKTVQNILDAGAGETWKTVNGPPLFKDLVFKAAQAVPPVLSGPSSAPGAVDLSEFTPKPLDFFTLEPNGEDFTMVGRCNQAEQLSSIFESFHSAPKMKVAVISASRGMGKTFFLKKMCLSRHHPFVTARNCGRIIVLECQKGLELLVDEHYEKFWSRLIIFHLAHLFNSYWCHTKQGIQFQFRDLTLRDVVKLTNVQGESEFEKWVYSITTLHSAVSELIRLTQIAYKTTNDSAPVFGLDNAHNFSKVLTIIPSTIQGKHNYLSRVLTHLTDVWCPCVVAGTTDQDIHIIGDYSNFVVEHIFLTRIERKHWNLMGEESIRKLNKIEGADVKWPVLEVSEYGDLDAQESDAAMTDATMAEDLGDPNMEMQGDYAEDQCSVP